MLHRVNSRSMDQEINSQHSKTQHDDNLDLFAPTHLQAHQLWEREYQYNDIEYHLNDCSNKRELIAVDTIPVTRVGTPCYLDMIQWPTSEYKR